MYTAPKPFYQFPADFTSGKLYGRVRSFGGAGNGTLRRFCCFDRNALGGELGFPPPMGCTVEIGNKKVKEK